jgi:hypothetical protein
MAGLHHQQALMAGHHHPAMAPLPLQHAAPPQQALVCSSPLFGAPGIRSPSPTRSAR